MEHVFHVETCRFRSLSLLPIGGVRVQRTQDALSRKSVRLGVLVLGLAHSLRRRRNGGRK